MDEPRTTEDQFDDLITQCLKDNPTVGELQLVASVLGRCLELGLNRAAVRIHGYVSRVSRSRRQSSRALDSASPVFLLANDLTALLDDYFAEFDKKERMAKAVAETKSQPLWGGIIHVLGSADSNDVWWSVASIKEKLGAILPDSVFTPNQIDLSLGDLYVREIVEFVLSEHNPNEHVWTLTRLGRKLLVELRK